MFFKIRKPPIIISVGGSLIVPNGGIDTNFLTKLNYFIRNYIQKDFRFFLVAGGGKIARIYRDAAKKVIGEVSNEDLDWLAIHLTRVNGHLLRTIFQDIAHPRIIENYQKKLKNWREPVVIGAGWKPGWSTDYDAVILAKDYGATTIINLSNIYYVYDKDPKKFKDAKPIKKITWEELEVIVGKKWTPGLSVPFDPIATQLAKKLNLTVIITNGKDFSNLQNIFEGKKFKGTVVTPFKINSSYYDREYYLKKTGLKFVIKQGIVDKLIKKITYWYRALIIKFYLNPKTVLDVGCGTGDLVRVLRKLGIEAYGLEISKDAISLSNNDVKPYLKLGDITNIPYPNNHFDLVVSFDVLERIEREKIEKAVKETIRVSKKYILHKIYTIENLWISLTHRLDFSISSLFEKRIWQNIFNSISNVKVLKKSIFRLPSFFETIFLLEKK